jgi:hypothetical protein
MPQLKTDKISKSAIKLFIRGYVPSMAFWIATDASVLPVLSAPKSVTTSGGHFSFFK